MSLSKFSPKTYEKPVTLRVALADTTTAGGVAAVANPFGAKAFITAFIIDVTTVATASATVDVGVAANGTTSGDNLVDGLDVNTATGMFNNGDNPGTNGKVMQVWTSSQFVTISQATGDVSDLEGFAYITCQRA